MLPQNNPDRTRIVFDDHRRELSSPLNFAGDCRRRIGITVIGDRGGMPSSHAYVAGFSVVA